MGLSDNQELSDLDFDRVFIGSCTNSRIEDLREAAEVLKGKKVSKSIQEAIVVPGSGMVKEQAEKEGIHKIFIEAGFEWRAPGCSMCLGMNPDQLSPYERCASLYTVIADTFELKAPLLRITFGAFVLRSAALKSSQLTKAAT